MNKVNIGLNMYVDIKLFDKIKVCSRHTNVFVFGQKIKRQILHVMNNNSKIIPTKLN